MTKLILLTDQLYRRALRLNLYISTPQEQQDKEALRAEVAEIKKILSRIERRLKSS